MESPGSLAASLTWMLHRSSITVDAFSTFCKADHKDPSDRSSGPMTHSLPFPLIDVCHPMRNIMTLMNLMNFKASMRENARGTNEWKFNERLWNINTRNYASAEVEECNSRIWASISSLTLLEPENSLLFTWSKHIIFSAGCQFGSIFRHEPVFNFKTFKWGKVNPPTRLSHSSGIGSSGILFAILPTIMLENNENDDGVGNNNEFLGSHYLLLKALPNIWRKDNYFCRIPESKSSERPNQMRSKENAFGSFPMADCLRLSPDGRLPFDASYRGCRLKRFLALGANLVRWRALHF